VGYRGWALFGFFSLPNRSPLMATAFCSPLICSLSQVNFTRLQMVDPDSPHCHPHNQSSLFPPLLSLNDSRGTRSIPFGLGLQYPLCAIPQMCEGPSQASPLLA
jgi:hypothetical protein